MTTKIDIKLETTINTGDFNNVKISYGIIGEPGPDESVKQAFTRIRSFLEAELMNDAAEVSEDWKNVRNKRYGK